MAQAGTSSAAGKLICVILTNGMPAAELGSVIEQLKNESKKIGTHKRRELFWKAYTMMASKAQSMEGDVNAFILYRGSEEGEGQVEIIELTKRQRGLVAGSIELVGRKVKSPENPLGKQWVMAWSEDEAQVAWDDLMAGEPCIYISADGVYVATRFKRVLCKALTAPLKALKDVEALVAELKPDNPLRSVAFDGHTPPTVTDYNIFLAGPSPLAGQLPPHIGATNATSTIEIYDYFLKRQNQHLVNEAGKLISQMLADVGKNLQPLISTGKKDASKAYLNSLMKRVYVHESMEKFIERVKADGQVQDVNIIKGDVADSEFGRYGMVVFEMFYRTDLNAFK